MFDLQSLGIEYGTLAMFVMLLGFLITGMPLAFVTLLIALIFTLGWFGPMAVPLITSRVYSFVSSFVFVSVPMFVLMAAILDRSGIARDLFDAMRLFGGRLRGGVAVQMALDRGAARLLHAQMQDQAALVGFRRRCRHRPPARRPTPTRRRPTTEETWEGFYLREQHKDDGVPERGDEMTVRTDARTRRPSSGRWTGSGCTPGEPW